jgi:hypothetical protein
MTPAQLQAVRDALLGKGYITPLGTQWKVVIVDWTGLRCRVYLEGSHGGYWDLTLEDWTAAGVVALNAEIAGIVAAGFGDEALIEAAASLDDMIGQGV